MTKRPPLRGRAASAILATMLAGGSLAAAVLATALFAAPAAHADSWRDKQYWLKESGITNAWQVSKGAGVKVAIIDSGVDGEHPDLTGAVTGGTDVSGAGSPDGEKSIGAKPEHGTLVATLLAGRGHQPANPSPGAGASPKPVTGGPAAVRVHVARLPEPGWQDRPGADPGRSPLGGGQRRKGDQHFPRQHFARVAAKLGRSVSLRRAEGRGDRRRGREPGWRQRPGGGTGHHPGRADGCGPGRRGKGKPRLVVAGHQYRCCRAGGEPRGWATGWRLCGLGRDLRRGPDRVRCCGPDSVQMA